MIDVSNLDKSKTYVVTKISSSMVSRLVQIITKKYSALPVRKIASHVFALIYMDEFSDIKQRITALETKIDTLPCTSHTEKITDLGNFKYILIGIHTGISAFIATVATIVTNIISKG